MTTFKLNDEITFGKYKGKLVSDVLDLDPEYLVWACNKIEWFELHFKAMEELMDVTMKWDDNIDFEPWDNGGHPLNFGDK